MNREEVIDLAMDIFENTDATMEEAMGVAIESAENKMSDAEKYRRRRLKAQGAAIAAARPGKYEGLSHEARWQNRDSNGNFSYRKGPEKNVFASGHGIERNDKLRGYTDDGFVGSLPKKRYASRNYISPYSTMTPDQKRKIDRQVDNYGLKQDRSTVKARSNYIKTHPEYSKFDRYDGYDKYGRVKASKEAAIMDTALDYMDMYDVSLEEAIDMAYDYLID